MAKDRKGWLALSIVLVVLLASGSASLGAVAFGLKTTGTTTSGNVVYVSVANPTSWAQSGTVTVSAVVNGATVTGMALTFVGAGKSEVVAVTLPAAPSKVISCGIVTEGGDLPF